MIMQVHRSLRILFLLLGNLLTEIFLQTGISFYLNFRRTHYINNPCHGYVDKLVIYIKSNVTKAMNRGTGILLENKLLRNSLQILGNMLITFYGCFIRPEK